MGKRPVGIMRSLLLFGLASGYATDQNCQTSQKLGSYLRIAYSRLLAVHCSTGGEQNHFSSRSLNRHIPLLVILKRAHSLIGYPEIDTSPYRLFSNRHIPLSIILKKAHPLIGYPQIGTSPHRYMLK